MAEVLVTGGTGFLGAHTIARLLTDGHRVRTTVRSLSRQGDVEAMLRTAGTANVAGIRYFQADLTRDDGWAEAEGADHVLHVASPFPGSAPTDENEVIVPARDGVLRVLRAARDAGVARVVLTSSFAAVGYGHGRTSRVFDESDWTDVNGPGVGAYVRSKAIAERAARRRRQRTQPAGAGLQQLIEGWPLTPAYAQATTGQVTAANRLAVALSPFFAVGSNPLRAAFVEPAMRQLYPDWDTT